MWLAMLRTWAIVIARSNFFQLFSITYWLFPSKRFPIVVANPFVEVFLNERSISFIRMFRYYRISFAVEVIETLFQMKVSPSFSCTRLFTVLGSTGLPHVILSLLTIVCFYLNSLFRLLFSILYWFMSSR